MHNSCTNIAHQASFNQGVPRSHTTNRSASAATTISTAKYHVRHQDQLTADAVSGPSSVRLVSSINCPSARTSVDTSASSANNNRVSSSPLSYDTDTTAAAVAEWLFVISTLLVCSFRYSSGSGNAAANTAARTLSTCASALRHEKDICMDGDAGIWIPEDVGGKARAVVSSRYIAAFLSLLLAVMLLVIIVLLGVMVGRRDPDVAHAVRHLFVRVDSERLPMLPVHYPGTGTRYTPPELMVVLGDGWAGGLGVDSTADDSWWAQLRERHLPQLAIVRATNATARTGDIAAQGRRLSLPPTMQGRSVAVVVQCGWNDIVQAQTENRLDTLDIHTLADQMVVAVRALVAQPAFQRAASVAVYLVDYPDASAGTGFTGLACEAPLDRIYNHATAVDAHLRALDMYSQALLGAAHNEGFAFVPLRATLRNVGSPEAMHTVARLDHAPVGVDGRRVSSPPPAAFTTKCGLMSSDGQRYQCDLVAAHFTNDAYFIVG